MSSPAGKAGLGAAALLATAAFLRLWDLGSADVWVDEANAVLIARGPLAQLCDRLALDSSPPLFYLLLHAWIGLFGDGEAIVRLPSALAGIALVAAIWRVGSLAVSPAAGWWAGWLAALAPVALQHARQARMYSLLPLLALLSCAFLVRALREGRARDHAAWVGTTLLALYLHNMALHLLPLQALLIALAGAPRPRWLALGAAAIAGGYAPLVPLLRSQLANPDHYAWLEPLWRSWGPHGAVARTLGAFSPGADYLLYVVPGRPDWRWIPASLCAALGGWGARSLWKRRGELGALGALWIPAFLVVPAASALVLSALGRPHYVPSRVDQLFFPAFALLVGAGIAAMQPRALRVSLGFALCAIAVITSLAAYREAGRLAPVGDRALAQAIAREHRPGEVILCTSLTRASLAYYLGPAGIEESLISYPRDTARHLGAQNDARLLVDAKGLDRELEEVLAEARARTAAGGRLFVVRVHTPINVLLEPRRLTSRAELAPLKALGSFVQSGPALPVSLELYRFR